MNVPDLQIGGTKSQSSQMLNEAREVQSAEDGSGPFWCGNSQFGGGCLHDHHEQNSLA
jgi:hypothetical protein